MTPNKLRQQLRLVAVVWEGRNKLRLVATPVATAKPWKPRLSQLSQLSQGVTFEIEFFTDACQYPPEGFFSAKILIYRGNTSAFPTLAFDFRKHPLRHLRHCDKRNSSVICHD